MTAAANWVANGASLEDCHSNLFSLVSGGAGARVGGATSPPRNFLLPEPWRRRRARRPAWTCVWKSGRCGRRGALGAPTSVAITPPFPSPSPSVLFFFFFLLPEMWKA